MVNDKETFRRFGYRLSELKPASHKKLVCNCPQCGEERLADQRSCFSVCYTCTQKNKGNILGEKSKKRTKRPPHSEITKRKMSLKAKRRLKVIKIKPKIVRKGKDHHLYGKPLSESHRQKISKANSGCNNANYGKVATHGKGVWYTNKYGNKIWLRSSWEEKVAIYLDDNNYIWDFERFVFPVNYKINQQEKQGAYIPDFCVYNNSGFEFWEVKGWWRDDAKAKFESFCKQYPEYSIKIIDKEGMKRLGL